MVKSRRIIKKGLKTKKFKNGGRKTNGYNQLITTQMQGGQASPNPAPASGLNIYNIDTVSLRGSLQSFGDAVSAFVATAQTDLDTFKTPSNIPTTGVTAGSLYALLIAQRNSANNLLLAANNVMSVFYNTNSTATNGIPPGGIYRAVYGNSAVFVATPTAPAPRPAPRPAAAASGGYNHDGGQSSPAPSPSTRLATVNEPNLLASLQAFGNKLLEFKAAAQAQVEQLATPGTLPPGTESTIGPAYSAFVAQQNAARDLVTAADSVMMAFAGSPGPYDGVNGTRGLYRAIMGNNANFTASSPAP